MDKGELTVLLLVLADQHPYSIPVQVYRHPMAPTDEVYFGNSPYAAFTIPTWVRVGDLSPEERAKYDEQEKKNEETRARWRKELAEKRPSEKDGDAVGSGTDATDKSDDEVAETASGDQEGAAGSEINESSKGTGDDANIEVDPDAGSKEIASEGPEGANDISGTTQEAVERGNLPQDAGELSVEMPQEKDEPSDKATVGAEGLDCKEEKEDLMEVAE